MLLQNVENVVEVLHNTLGRAKLVKIIEADFFVF